MENSELPLILAYIGPGLGTGVIATVIGVIASILLAIFAILWYPFKRLIKRLKSKKAMEDSQSASAQTESKGQ